MTENKSKRLFIALPLPEEAQDALKKLHQRIKGVRWTAPQNLHLTLRFIGASDVMREKKILNALYGIIMPQITLHLRGVGFWPGILWVGVEASQELVRLKQAVNGAFMASDIKPEPKKFMPHVTIARTNSALQIEELQSFLERNASFSMQPVMIDRLALYESQTLAEGSIYHETVSYTLRARKGRI